MLTLILIAAATGLCTGLGSLPFWFVRAIPRRLFDLILGFGAGLMLSAATLGLLHEALEEVRSHDGGELDLLQFALVLVGFACGFVILFAVEKLIPHHHAGGHHQHLKEGARFHEDELAPAVAHEGDHAHVRKGMIISGALVFHRLPEGFAIGSSFANGGTAALGMLIAVAVGLQNICEGMVMSAPLRAGGMRRLSVLALTTATGLTVPITAILGYLLSQHVEGAMPFALALASGSLIGVTSNEIIPETHGHGSEGLATAGIVLGFVFFMLMRVGLGVH